MDQHGGISPHVPISSRAVTNKQRRVLSQPPSKFRTHQSPLSCYIFIRFPYDKSYGKHFGELVWKGLQVRRHFRERYYN